MSNANTTDEQIQKLRDEATNACADRAIARRVILDGEMSKAFDSIEDGLAWVGGTVAMKLENQGLIRRTGRSDNQGNALVQITAQGRAYAAALRGAK